MIMKSRDRGHAPLVAFAVASAMVAGCAVGPAYEKPEMQVAPQFRAPQALSSASSLADLPWWEVFDDKQLQALINQALANNLDIKVAAARIEQARARVGVAKSEGRPQVGYNVDGGAAESVLPLSGGVDQVQYTGVSAGANLLWELDLWGRVRYTATAAQAGLYAQEEIRRGVLLSLASDVASGYFRLLALDRELAIAENSAEVFRRNVELFTLRFEAGRDTRLPVERAQANYHGSQDRIAELKQAIGQQENLLSILLGGYPGAITRGRPLGEQSSPETPVGLTTDLLQRRPDIRAAEQNMINANAQVGIAAANYFPRIGLSGFFGGRSLDIEDVVSDTFSIWNIAGTVAGPLFTGGRLSSSKAGRQAYWDETVSQYRKTVLTAFQETSDALLAQQALAARTVALEGKVGALQRSVELATERYEGGRASYFEVLEAEQQLFPAQYVLTQVRRDQLIAVVDLYKALGGGWKLEPEAWIQPD
jgi:outer membrane protein, multidrug efflux system